MKDKLMYIAALISFCGAGFYLGLGYFIAAFIFFILGTSVFISRSILIDIFKQEKAVA